MKRHFLETKRLWLVSLEETDAPMLLQYFLDNQDFLQAWEPAKEADFYTEGSMVNQIAADRKDILEGRGVRLWITLKDKPDQVIGSVALSNIVMGPFQSCFMGYRLDHRHVGQGLMTEALQKLVDFGFDRIGLHRIEANIMPVNKPSIRVVQRLGFEYEGTSRKYLKINGQWEDHMHMVLLNEAMEKRRKT